MSLVLDNPRLMPNEFQARLHDFASSNAIPEYMDQLEENRTFRSIADNLDKWIREQRVRLFHCTKELEPGLIEARGLRPLTVKDHHREFLEFIDGRAPDCLVQTFRAALEDFLTWGAIRVRENRIWFCGSPNSIDWGCRDFFDLYGGEAIYFSVIEKHEECANFLRSLGSPVVVEVEVPFSDFKTFQSAARTMLSTWAMNIREDFNFSGIEGYLSRPVLPDEIIAVHPAQEFCRQHLRTASQ